MSSVNDILLNFSYTYDKITKINLHNLTPSLQSIHIQIELIMAQLEDEDLDNFTHFQYIFDWAKICQQSLKINYIQTVEDAILLEEINQNLLEIFNLLSHVLDQRVELPSILCIANEYGNIITTEEKFYEFIGNSTSNIVNFTQLIDIYGGPKIQNSENSSTIVYTINYNYWEEQFDRQYSVHHMIQAITANKERYFIRFKLNATVSNFEFTELEEQTSFFFYHPLHALSEQNQRVKRLLVLQFIKMPYSYSQCLDEYIASEKFVETVRKFASKLSADEVKQEE